jgi:hypothetical protein
VSGVREPSRHPEGLQTTPQRPTEDFESFSCLTQQLSLQDLKVQILEEFDFVWLRYQLRCGVLISRVRWRPGVDLPPSEPASRCAGKIAIHHRAMEHIHWIPEHVLRVERGK